MQLWDNVPVTTALLLAVAAAVMSSRPVTRQEVSDYLSEALAPQVADLGKFTTEGWRAPQ